MKLDYLKDREEFMSLALLGFSALLSGLILVKVVGFFVSSARADRLVGDAVAQSTPDPNAMEKYLTKSKETAAELKKKNLFAPPPPKKNPVSQVSGILGDEVLINGKWYKVGDTVGDAKILAIDPTFVKIEWDGKEKVYAPIGAAGASGSDGRAGANGDKREGKENENGRGDRERKPRREGRRVFGRLSAEEKQARVRAIAERRRMSGKARESEVPETK